MAGLASALLPDDDAPWSDWVADYDRIRDLIEAAIPGFENYNQRVRDRNGFALPNGPREGRFTTADGKAHFTVHPLPDLSLPEGRYWLMTTRTQNVHPECSISSHSSSKRGNLRLKSRLIGCTRS